MKLTAREWLLLPKEEQMQRGKELSPEECFKLRMELSEINFTEEEKQNLTKEQRERFINPPKKTDEEIEKIIGQLLKSYRTGKYYLKILHLKNG